MNEINIDKIKDLLANIEKEQNNLAKEINKSLSLKIINSRLIDNLESYINKFNLVLSDIRQQLSNDTFINKGKDLHIFQKGTILSEEKEK